MDYFNIWRKTFKLRFTQYHAVPIVHLTKPLAYHDRGRWFKSRCQRNSRLSVVDRTGSFQVSRGSPISRFSFHQHSPLYDSSQNMDLCVCMSAGELGP